MQEMIERILEMDKAARRLTDEAQELRVNAEKEIELKKQQLHKDYLERAERKIEKLREEEESNAEKEMAAFRIKAQSIRDALNQSYNENHEKWVNDIFSQITGR